MRQLVKTMVMLLLVLAGAAGCPLEQRHDPLEELRASALEFAKLYTGEDTDYEWGGQDPLRAIRIDCSGLVVMCYKYALADTAYGLPFNDATARDMRDLYSRPTEAPLPGDLVFMGSAGEDAVTHIALFKERKDGCIFFIDATEKEADGGYPAVNGVSERNYPEGDARFKSFGILQVIRTR